MHRDISIQQSFACPKANQVVRLSVTKRLLFADQLPDPYKAIVLRFNCTGMHSCGIMRQVSPTVADPDLSLCVYPNLNSIG
jgi:hypothetical protein